MGCRTRQLLSWLLLLGAIVLGLAIGLGLVSPPSAIAAIRYVDEAPGQFVVQSRQTLTDQHGYSWQAIAFKRRQSGRSVNFDLRLVGFPGVVTIDRTQPLTLTSSLGETWTAIDSSSRIFSDSGAPQPHVGQYDLQPLVADLPVAIPIRLSVPTIGQHPIQLSVPPSVIQEWRQVALEE